MIYPNEAFYVVGGFSYRSDLGVANSAYNFSIGLKPDFALKAYNKELPDNAFKKLNEIGITILKDLGFSSLMRQPYMFLENDKGKFTSLLRWCDVPGDACGLSLEGSQINYLKNEKLSHRMIEYNSHNIDSMLQAYSLLSLWLQWADTAFAVTNKT